MNLEETGFKRRLWNLKILEGALRFLFEIIIYKKKKEILIYDINGRYKITGN